MPNPSHSTVHLTMRKGKETLSIGSGVLYERNNEFFIATAWHNFTGRHSDSLCLLSNRKAVPDNVVVTVALLISGSGGNTWRMSFTIPLEDDEKTNYLIHPQGWPRVDIAVLPINPDTPLPFEGFLPDGSHFSQTIPMRQHASNGGIGTEIQTIQQCAGTYASLPIPPHELIDPGDDLFVLGYPRGIVDYTMEPIWKRATVASNPRIGWNQQEQFLVDCASRQGMSGGPVISYTKSGAVRVGGMVHIGQHPSAALCGIYVGRILDIQSNKEDQLFEAQLGTVWRANLIDEIIDAKVLAPQSNMLIASTSEIDKAIAGAWPSEGIADPATCDYPAFRQSIMRKALVKLCGNAAPADVEEALLRRIEAVQPL